MTGGPGVDVVVAVEGVSACSGGRRLVILTEWRGVTSTASFHGDVVKPVGGMIGS